MNNELTIWGTTMHKEPATTTDAKKAARERHPAATGAAMEVARTLAGGDMRRVEVQGDGTVWVIND